MEQDKTILTQAGVKKLKDELKRLIDEERPAVIEQIKEARSQGDLSENADYDAARARQAIVEQRIQELQKMLSNVKIIEDIIEEENVKLVRLGSTVTIKKIDDHHKEIGDEIVYTIVGSVEADPENGRISNECPLAVALLSKEVNDVVTVKVAKPYKVKIVDVKR
ncbi:TPA: transcription elongation factor GreA [bacterium]|nr:transcription elongation factor GreA [bacterium]